MLSGLLLAAGTARAGPGEVIRGTPTGDPSLDRQNIQAALDAAAPGDTVLLEARTAEGEAGAFQLDGERVYIDKSRVTLTGEALDNDGDGAVNEDWADGVDNGGDDSTDEDEGSSALRNTITGANLGIVSQAGVRNLIHQDEISGCFIRINGWRPTVDSHTSEPLLMDNHHGVWIDATYDPKTGEPDEIASGSKARHNSFEGSLSVDYYLDPTSSENLMVLADPATSVEDNGTGNRIVGRR